MAVDPTQITPAAPSGLVGEAEQALATRPSALLAGAGAALAYAGALFAITLIWALAGNPIAQAYMRDVFGATGVWVAAAAALVGGAYVLPSPITR